MKTTEGVGIRSLTRNTSKVEGHVGTPGRRLGQVGQSFTQTKQTKQQVG
jgi:hypothetical protein